MIPFRTCKAGLTIRSQLRSQVHTHNWSPELNSSAPCGTRIWTGIHYGAASWHNKSCSRIIPRANPRTIFRHPCDPTLPSPLAHHTRNNLWRKMMEIFLSKKSGILAYKTGIGQKLDQNGESKSYQHRI